VCWRVGFPCGLFPPLCWCFPPRCLGAVAPPVPLSRVVASSMDMSHAAPSGGSASDDFVTQDRASRSKVRSSTRADAALPQGAILKLGNSKCCKCPCVVLVTTCGAQRTVIVWRVWDCLLYVCEFEMKEDGRWKRVQHTLRVRTPQKHSRCVLLLCNTYVGMYVNIQRHQHTPIYEKKKCVGRVYQRGGCGL